MTNRGFNINANGNLRPRLLSLLPSLPLNDSTSFKLPWCSFILVWWMLTGGASRREESYSFPAWKLLFPFRSTYHNNIASMTSAASEQFSLQIFGRINGHDVREKAELLFFLLSHSFPLFVPVSVFLKTLTHKDGGAPAERMMGGKQVIGVRSKLRRKKKPSTHHLEAHMCHPLHAWPQPFHVTQRKKRLLWEVQQETFIFHLLSPLFLIFSMYQSCQALLFFFFFYIISCHKAIWSVVTAMPRNSQTFYVEAEPFSTLILGAGIVVSKETD